MDAELPADSPSRALLPAVQTKSGEDSDPALRCFFFVGVGCTVAFEAICMSLAYLRQVYGAAVLSSLGLCQWAPALATILYYTVVRSDELKQSEFTSRMPLAVLYMLFLSAALVLSCATGYAPDVRWLYAAVLLNGVAAGTLQTLSSSLAGLYSQRSNSRGAHSAVLRGMAGGVIGPCVLQIALMMFLSPSQAHVGAAAACSVSIAALMCAFVAFRRLAATNFGGAFVKRRPRADTIGKCIHSDDCALRDYAKDRLIHGTVLNSLQFVNAFATVAAGISLPFLRPSSVSPLMQVYMATALLAATNLSEFAGRLLSPTQYAEDAPPGVAFVAVAARAAIGALCVYSVHTSALPDAVLAACYVAGAVCGGANTVAMSARSQRECQHSLALPCPITAQYTVLSLQLGAIAAATFTTLTAHV